MKKRMLAIMLALTLLISTLTGVAATEVKTINVSGVHVEYTLDKGLAQIRATNQQWLEIFSQEDWNILFDLFLIQAKSAKITFPLALFNGTGKVVTIKLEYGHSLQLPATLFAQNGKELTVFFDGRNVSVLIDGFAVASDSKTPLTLGIPAGLSEQQTHILGTQGLPYPRSWSSNGLLYAKVPAPITQATFIPFTPVSQTFQDVKDSWVAPAVNELTNRGVVKGTSKDKFTPQANVTRAEFVTMLMRYFGYSDPDNTMFVDHSDIPIWAENAVYSAKKLSIVRGDSNGKFNPMASVTRQDMFVMLARTMAQMGLLSPQIAPAPAFPDDEDIAEYAKSDVEILTGLQLAKGTNGYLQPRANSTRAQCAKLLFNLLEYDSQYIHKDLIDPKKIINENLSTLTMPRLIRSLEAFETASMRINANHVGGEIAHRILKDPSSTLNFLIREKDDRKEKVCRAVASAFLTNKEMDKLNSLVAASTGLSDASKELLNRIQRYANEVFAEADHIAELTKAYILTGQNNVPYPDQLKWVKEFLEQTDVVSLYYTYSSIKNNIEVDIIDFAKFITFNAPILSNWKSLFEKLFYAQYEVEQHKITRYEPIEYGLYQVYAIVYGEEVPFLVVNPRIGFYRG